MKSLNRRQQRLQAATNRPATLEFTCKFSPNWNSVGFKLLPLFNVECYHGYELSEGSISSAIIVDESIENRVQAESVMHAFNKIVFGL